MEFKPHEYQVRCIDSILEQERIGLFLDMGLGKTVITLTAIEKIRPKRCLVIAPKRVAEDTWSREHEKWDHLSTLRISKVLGTQKQRLEALEAEADIYVISRDNVAWLIEHYLTLRRWPFDMVVIDELSSFKNPQSKRFKALRKAMAATKRVVGLTGTPSPNGLMDLWSQIYLLDQGERLGKTLTSYRSKYFSPGATFGHIVYNWVPVLVAKEAIEGKLKDLCISMRAEDYLSLPECMYNHVPVKLSKAEKATYDELEREMLIELDGEKILGLTAAAVLNKLLQLANGNAYSATGAVVPLHRKKLEALEEIVDTSTEPVLVFYAFKHDLDAIQSAVPSARLLETEQDIADWNAGKIEVLVAHPASVGYGLNLQDGGSTIVWYGLTWSLEQYQQANARLHRQGQSKPVIIHHLVAEDTVDEQVLRALQRKDASQEALLNALKERRLS